MIEPGFSNGRQYFARYATMRDCIAVGFRRRKIVLTCFCGVFLGAVAFAWFWAANYFESSMDILVEQDRSDPAISSAQNAAILTNTAVTPDQINSEVALLQGWDMLHSVVATCGLANHSLTDVLLPGDLAQKNAAREAKATKYLAKALNVDVVKNADVIRVTYGKRGARETPACILDNLGKLYLEKHLQLRRPVGTSEFFAQQTDTYQRALETAEARLTDFGREHGVVAPDVVRTDMAQQMVNSVAALHQAQQTIAADQRRIEEDQKQLDATPERSPTQEMSNSADMLLQNLQSTLLAAEVKRSQLLLKFEPTYPLVVQAEQEIAQTQAAISKAKEAQYVNRTTDRDPTHELLREDIAKTRADLASQRATAGALKNSIQSMQSQMVDLDGQAIKQASLIREAKANEANYLLYLGKREQERTADALDKRRIANVAIAVPPTVPALPVHSPLTVTLLGFVLAVFASIAAAFLADYMDSSFLTPDEVADTLNLPVLASVPRRAA
jgi:Uncharacterized protein involved in exopolysaccharide biosynthesis